MGHALLQVDCTAKCIGSACTKPSFNDENPSSVFCFNRVYYLKAYALKRRAKNRADFDQVK